MQKLKFSQKKKGIRSNMVLEVLIFLPLARATVGRRRRLLWWFFFNCFGDLALLMRSEEREKFGSNKEDRLGN